MLSQGASLLLLVIDGSGRTEIVIQMLDAAHVKSNRGTRGFLFSHIIESALFAVTRSQPAVVNYWWQWRDRDNLIQYWTLKWKALACSTYDEIATS